MLRNLNKLLIALLVLLIAVGPIGNVIASPHSCAPAAGQGTMLEDTVNSDRGFQKATGHTHVAAPSNQNCNGCDKDCCKGGHCKIGHCAGTAAAFQRSTTLEFERSAVSAIVLSFDRPLVGPITPPFRPPQA